MGYILNVDLETSMGPSHEVYARIESLVFNKVKSEIQLQITYWLNKNYPRRCERLTIDEPIKGQIGLVQERVLYYQTSDSEGEEILLPHHLKLPMVSSRMIDEPKFEIQDVEIEVPYIGFDENGDEIIKHRKIIKQETVNVGTTEIEKEVIDNSILKDVFGFGYTKIKERLSQHFPVECIIQD